MKNLDLNQLLSFYQSRVKKVTKEWEYRLKSLKWKTFKEIADCLKNTKQKTTSYIVF